MSIKIEISIKINVNHEFTILGLKFVKQTRENYSPSINLFIKGCL